MKIFMLFLILFFSCLPIFGQNCGTTSVAYFGNLSDKEYKNKLDKFSAIFYGQVISQSEPFRPEKEFPYRILRVKVLRVWKGIDTGEVDIKFRYYDNDCLKLGESGELIFYTLSSKSEPPFQMDWTSKYSFKDERTKQTLGEGIVFEHPQFQPVSQMENNESFWTAFWKSVSSFFS